MNILAFGDIFGRPGRQIFSETITDMKNEFAADFIVANIENASGGAGVTDRNARELLSLSEVDCFTGGNHIFDQRDILNILDETDRILRPANYPDPCPGKGYAIHSCLGKKIAVLNLSGNSFMRENLENPFVCFDKLYEILREESDIIIVDFHADATSEKIAFGYFADERANVVYGTHTHVQTADERILDGGCGYITDIGMCGPYDGVIGVSREIVIRQFLSQRRHMRYDVAQGQVQINGALFTLDDATLRCTEITRVRRIFDQV